LTAHPWRIGELGEVCATASPDTTGWSASEMAPEIPSCAAALPTFVEATRDKEVQAMLKCGRDNQWPLRITMACNLSENVAVSVTYSIGRGNCTSNEEWFRARLQKMGSQNCRPSSGASSLCVFIEQFPRGVCTISSVGPQPRISNKLTRFTLPLNTLESIESILIPLNLLIFLESLPPPEIERLLANNF
jgi:hypothetical protein